MCHTSEIWCGNEGGLLANDRGGTGRMSRGVLERQEETVEKWKGEKAGISDVEC